MLVSNILRITDKDERFIYGKELVRSEKDFYDILVKYMGHEVADYFSSYVDGLKRETQYLEAEIEELETELDIMCRLP